MSSHDRHVYDPAPIEEELEAYIRRGPPAAQPSYRPWGQMTAQPVQPQLASVARALGGKGPSVLHDESKRIRDAKWPLTCRPLHTRSQ